VSTAVLTPRARPDACRVPRLKYASERATFCHTHDRTSSQFEPTNYDARVRGSTFLEVDPVEGGSCNDYDYVCGDPVNDLDLDGRFSWRGVLKIAAIVGGVAGAVACGVSVVCAVAVGAAAGAGSYAAGHAGKADFSWAGLAGSAAIGGVLGGLSAGGVLGRAAFRAPGIGARSRLLGDVYSGASRPGLLNPAGKSARWALGWSGKKAGTGARTVLRAKVGGIKVDLLNGPYR
jgi:hypothetical protein